MRDLFLIPAADLDNMERSVYFMVSSLMASGIPGTIFSHTASVASGVTSLGAKPVPPVVTIRAISFDEALIMASDIFSFSSGTISYYTTSDPSFLSISSTAGPL